MKNLRRRRDEANLSRWELSIRSGVSPQTISDIEMKGTNPRVDIAEKLATALGTTVDDLIGGEEKRVG